MIEPLDGHATHFVKRGIDDHCDDSKRAFKVAALLHAPKRRFKAACRHGHGWWESPACSIVSSIYPIESRLNGQITLVRHAKRSEICRHDAKSELGFDDRRCAFDHERI
ncbi:hypothetical protein [Mycetohabitans rhizoxinica]|uniref:Transposase n=1 Tax=Mycetohabitans rhizoxinica TaxID=412963 RepID=A0ABZ2Q2C4_9BURK